MAYHGTYPSWVYEGGETLNISIGGAFIRCSEVPELDENFRLTISCTEEKRLITLAREVWSKPFFIGKTMFCGMGVFFEYILDKDRRFLSSVMSKYF